MIVRVQLCRGDFSVFGIHSLFISVVGATCNRNEVVSLRLSLQSHYQTSTSMSTGTLTLKP
eukprot:3944936-Pyramimonas_sp.AAC.1